MILSNVEIQAALDDDRLIIQPDPQPRTPVVGKYCPYGTHSVDLTLGEELIIPQRGTFAYDLTQPGKVADFIGRNSTKRTIAADAPFPLEHGRFILGITRETVGLPIPNEGKVCLTA